MTFKEAAILSSNQYYKYLDANKGSLIVYHVVGIRFEETYYYLQLKKSPRMLDSLQIKINANIFSHEQFKCIDYNKNKKELKISVDTTLVKFLRSAKPEQVKIIIDLKFLVKNVSKFYESYGNKLSLPKKHNNIRYREDKRLSDKPSDEQVDAVKGALNNPLSYIWGAPGTGKTRFVLARCVLSYIKQCPNAKILITAPTNNAVEQTLFGVLPVLEKCGIELEKVFRLGVPSVKFYSSYPECCEYNEAEIKLEKAKNELKKIDDEINQTNYAISLIPEYENCLEFESYFEKCKSEYSQKFEEMQTLLDENKELLEAKSINNGKINYIDSQIQKLNNDKSKYISTVENLTFQINKHKSGLRRLFFKSKYLEYTSKLEIAISALDKIKNEISEFILKKQQLNTIDVNNSMIYLRNNARYEKLKLYLLELTVFWDKLNNIIKTLRTDNLKSVSIIFTKTINKGALSLEIRKKKYRTLKVTEQDALYKKLSDLTELKSELVEKYEKLASKTSAQRLNKCKVLAATIDTCFRRVYPDGEFTPSHIFLDEAGYCPLIKGVALLAYHCPLTLLGDHMQLPPVCEMNDNEFIRDNKIVALYAQSALFLEHYQKDVNEIISDYLIHNPPEFNYTAYFELNYTFRFDEKLARILAKNVYTSRFRGTDSHTTNIYFIDSQKREEPKTRKSISEIKNILTYVNNHKDENIGIITPYLLQSEELIKRFPPEQEIYTVHGSQGREWDTVILSVVDTTDTWFTNSQNTVSNGLKVINTAVSRTKKRLIIVCDYTYWKSKHVQLIGQLLEIAEEIIL